MGHTILIIVGGWLALDALFVAFLYWATSGRQEQAGSRAVVALDGELDFSEAHTLAAALLAAEREEPRHLVVDLAELTFIDAAGMRVLVEAARRANNHRRPIMFVEPLQEIRRILELVGLD